MKDSLADALLGEVMGWSDPEPDTVEKLQRLQILARHKYNHYEQFRPGRKFIESLAAWLRQFRSRNEREVALNFVLKHLIFISNDEMEQLVRILYPQKIRPIIRDYVGRNANLPAHAVSRIEEIPEFAQVRRRSLFLGLSDGARMDEFRRSNRVLSNEQIYATYEVAERRLKEMRRQLLIDQDSDKSDPIRFQLVFLIDDFAGSGKTILRPNDGEFVGRLQRFSDLLHEDSEDSASVLSGAETEIHICLYVATEQAVEHLTDSISRYTKAAWTHPPVVHVVQFLNHDQRVNSSLAPEFCKLQEEYYDPNIEDTAKQVGGTSSKYGFADAALPVVLCHNSPNNSVSLLWAPPPMTALFPRFERHTETNG